MPAMALANLTDGQPPLPFVLLRLYCLFLVTQEQFEPGGFPIKA